MRECAHDEAVAFERLVSGSVLGNNRPMRTVTVIEAPTSAGSYAPGQEDGPRALLEAGLVERVKAAGVAVRRGGQVTPVRWRPDPDNPRAANAGAVIDRARQVAALVDPLQPRTRLWSSEATARSVSAPWAAFRIVLSSWGPLRRSAR
jgi:arginase family enzyme